MTSFSIDFDNIEEDIGSLPDPPWTITAGGQDVSKDVKKARVHDSISQPGKFSIEFLNPSIDFTGVTEVQVDIEGKSLYGALQTTSSSSNVESTQEGGGVSRLLDRGSITQTYNNDATIDTVIQNILSEVNMYQGPFDYNVDSTFSSEEGNVQIRFEDLSALEAINKVISDYGGEWKVNRGNNYYIINVDSRIESGSIVASFTGGGEDTDIQNLEAKQVYEEEYDAVTVKGYGDGEDQVSGTYPSSPASDARVLKYTDKTVLSDSRAADLAQKIYDNHTDWKNIVFVPADDSEIFDLGDMISISDNNTGVNGSFRVAERTLSLDFQTGYDVEYVLSDKPIGVIDELIDARRQTDSQTDYAQGNTAFLSEKESRNCSTIQPLQLDFYLSESIADKVGNNRVKGVKLNYKATEYKTNVSYNTSSRVKSLDTTSGKIDEFSDQSSGNAYEVDTVSIGKEEQIQKDTNPPQKYDYVESKGVTDETTGSDSRLYSGTWYEVGSSGGTTTDDGITITIPEENVDEGTTVEKVEFQHVMDIFLQPSTDYEYTAQYPVVYFRIKDPDAEDTTEYYPDSSGYEVMYYHYLHPHIKAERVPLTIEVPLDISGHDVKPQIKFDYAGGAVDDAYIFNTINWTVVSQHDHLYRPKHERDNPDDTRTVFNTDDVGGGISSSSSTVVATITTSSETNYSSISENTGEYEVVENLDESLGEGSKANNVQIHVDGTDVTEDIYGTNTSETSQDNSIDITEFLDADSEGKPSIGNHSVTIYPDTSTHMKCKVQTEFKKDT